jgi:hypothetical protein
MINLPSASSQDLSFLAEMIAPRLATAFANQEVGKEGGGEKRKNSDCFHAEDDEKCAWGGFPSGRQEKWGVTFGVRCGEDGRGKY